MVSTVLAKSRVYTLPMKPTRRAALAALALAPLAGCVRSSSSHLVDAQPGARTVSPKAFVFVPGTWHGGWVWRPVVDQLIARGHRAFAVTPTGVGERHHLMSPEVGLDTHIQDVVNCIEYEALEQVVLSDFRLAGSPLPAWRISCASASII